jgi:hypothetical protein
LRLWGVIDGAGMLAVVMAKNGGVGLLDSCDYVTKAGEGVG